MKMKLSELIERNLNRDVEKFRIRFSNSKIIELRNRTEDVSNLSKWSKYEVSYARYSNLRNDLYIVVSQSFKEESDCIGKKETEERLEIEKLNLKINDLESEIKELKEKLSKRKRRIGLFNR